MHDIAERGVAAHWVYKEGDGDIEKSSEAIDPWLENVRNLLEDNEQNALELVDQFKSNLFSHEVYCFTPKGELRRLKRGATALDFAYEIHSDIGNKCIATKANQKLVPLSYELKTGDQIEILTSRKQKPKEDWLSIAQTSKAISAIKRALKYERRALASEGRAIFERKAKRQNIPNTKENLNKILEVLDIPDSQEFFIQIQQGLNLSKVWTKFTLQNGQLVRKVSKTKPKLSVEETVIQNLQRKGELLIMGEESESIEHSFAQCCNPLPGDNVFGFITLNDGIKIHRVNCPNAVQLMSKYSYRIVQTSWSSKLKTSFLAHVQLRGIDGMGVVSRVTQRISHELNINIKSLSFESDQGVFTGHISLYVNNQNELQYILENLKKQEGIVSVERIDDHNTLHHNI
jgi:GTP pyrophosphokinase